MDRMRLIASVEWGYRSGLVSTRRSQRHHCDTKFDVPAGINGDFGEWY